MKGFLIAAATSNSGKTTITMGIMRALRDMGLKVQPFKCGPDYIDPMFHSLASGTESVNLDTWMGGEEHVKDLFSHYGKGADACVVEGVMGLLDGYDKWHGSCGEIAMMLDLPVILVVNAKSVAYSVAPLIYGFSHFNEKIRIAGVIFNMVASESHYAFLKEACEDAGVPCLGYMPKNPNLNIPGRHLGLTISAKEETERLICLSAEEIKKHINLDMLPDYPHGDKTKDTVSSNCHEDKETENSFISSVCGETPISVIAVAKDEAFNFTYKANIDALACKGEIRFFSPLRDKELPKCDLLYLPGGYPELFAKELAENEDMRKNIKNFAEQGGTIFAECGGFMYLCKNIDGTQMCDVLPFEATMEGAKLHLGYRTMEVDGKTFRGHEFHYSSIKPIKEMPDSITVEQCQYSAKGSPVDTAIYRYKNVIAGYTHWYWG